MKQTLKSILDPIVLAIAIITLLFCGCTRTIYTPFETRVETHANVADTLQTTRLSKLIDQLQKSVKSHEKVIVRDSVVYVVNEQGDVKSKEVYHDRNRDYSESEIVMRVTQIYDSVFQRQTQRIDSLLNEFRQEPAVIEKNPGFWSRLKDWIAGASAAIVTGGFFLLLRWFKSKFFS